MTLEDLQKANDLNGQIADISHELGSVRNSIDTILKSEQDTLESCIRIGGGFQHNLLIPTTTVVDVLEATYDRLKAELVILEGKLAAI